MMVGLWIVFALACAVVAGLIGAALVMGAIVPDLAAVGALFLFGIFAGFGYFGAASAAYEAR